GTSCAGVICTQPPAPHNDECAAATAGSAYDLSIPNRSVIVGQTLVGATASFGAGVSPPCTFADTDVWYRLSLTQAQSHSQILVVASPAPSAGDYTLEPLAIQVYDGSAGCPVAPGGEIACTDFGNPQTVVFAATGSTV